MRTPPPPTPPPPPSPETAIITPNDIPLPTAPTHNTTTHTNPNPKTTTNRFLGTAVILLAAVLVAAGCSSSREMQPSADITIGGGTAEDPSGAGNTAESSSSSTSSNSKAAETDTTLSGNSPTRIGGTTTTTSTTEAPPSEETERLQAEIDQLAEVAAAWDGKAEVALAVITSEGVSVGINADMRHSSASAAKSLWLAAALSHLGVEAVQPLVRGALVESENETAGEVIDLIGASVVAATSLREADGESALRGIAAGRNTPGESAAGADDENTGDGGEDIAAESAVTESAAGVSAVNEWTEEVAELKDTRLLAWRFPEGSVEAAQRRAPEIGENQAAENYTTTADLARFYAQLWRGELLGREETTALIGWLKTTEEGVTIDVVDGAMTQRLPSAVAEEVGHKAGWLPPSCCRVRLILDAGVVPLPNGGWFSMAALSMRGEHYELSLQWVALAACRIYLLLSGEEKLVCERPIDGIPNPEAWTPTTTTSTQPEPTTTTTTSPTTTEPTEPTTTTPPTTTEPTSEPTEPTTSIPPTTTTTSEQPEPTESTTSAPPTTTSTLPTGQTNPGRS